MGVPVFTREQFASAFLAMLPTGRAWAKDRDSNLAATVSALMPAFELSANRAAALVQDVFPATTNELLPEWEATTGLPDPCAGLAPSPEARRNQVVARFAGVGGQSIADLMRYADNLGYPITVTEFGVTRAGLMRAGEALLGDGVQFQLKVTAPVVNQRFFLAGTGAAGDPLSSFGNAVLECELATIKPAHSKLLHTYTGGVDVFAPGVVTNVVVTQ